LDYFNRQMRERNSDSTCICARAAKIKKHIAAASLDDQLSVIVLSRAPS
jgi:hypothetical protein